MIPPASKRNSWIKYQINSFIRFNSILVFVAVLRKKSKEEEREEEIDKEKK
jgi:hypothetical protein